MMNQKYKDYLQSDEWQKKRQQLFAERGKVCERCQSITNIQVHHKTYENIFNEKLSDLEVLCKICHENHHKRKETQPKKKKKAKPKKRKWIRIESNKFFVKIKSQYFGFESEKEALDFYETQKKIKICEYKGFMKRITKVLSKRN
jgi:hypothetical protein